MNFKISASAFAVILKQCSRVASKKSEGAASHVLIDVRDSEITVTAVNGSQQITLRTRSSSLEVLVPGSICAPAHKLDQIVSALPGDRDVSMSLLAEKLVLSCAKSKFKLSTLSVDTFPVIAPPAPTAEFRIDANALREAGLSVSPCAGRNDVRQFLNGVLLSLEGGKAVLVASDGHRMGVSEIPCADAPSVKAIIPLASVDDFLNFTTDDQAIIRLYPNLVSVTSAVGEFYTKLIDGNYPDFRRLTNAPASEEKLVVNRAALLSALQRAALMADERVRGVKLLLSQTGLSVTAISNDNMADETFDGEYTGSPMEVGFNAGYLVDILRSIASETVEFSFSGPSAGTHIAPPNLAHQKFVLMPMRT